MNVKKITPVLLVNEIESILPFWIGRLGFAKTIEVPTAANSLSSRSRMAPSK